MLGGVANELKPVYLLTAATGRRSPARVRRLRDRIGDDATEHLSARDASAADVVASCNALGLFGGEGRLVIVDEAGEVEGRGRQGDRRLSHGARAGTVLALVAEEIKADAPLAKAVAKAGQVLAYDVPKRKLPEWVAEQFGARRRSRPTPTRAARSSRSSATTWRS